ncbi:hypothetical protein [Prosthecobacter sp.]|uniref:hypothetical protein n=1 Tax=Prosthecobacter sp. TaxID=1965333 RepID=UPI0037844F23
MTPTDSPEATAAELNALRSELKEWAFGIRCAFAGLNLLPLYYCTRGLLSAPAFQSIFTDMLGSLDKLPPMTRFVITWSHDVLITVWILAVLAIVMIFRATRARTVWMTTLLLTTFLLITGHLVIATLFEPLGAVIQNLSGGTSS